MKKTLLSIPFLLMLFSVVAQNPDALVSCHLNQATFTEFANDIFKQSGVRIYYEEDWVDSLKVTCDNDKISVIQVVEKAIEGSKLNVSRWNKNLVLLPEEKLIDSLPSFETKRIVIDTQAEDQKEITITEERYITGRKPDVIQTIRIGKAEGTNSNNKVKVFGRVLDAETGEPVAFANMFIDEVNSASMADGNGFITTFLKPGKYNAIFEFLGYVKVRYLLDVLSAGEFTIQMKRAVIQMKDVVVHGDRQSNIQTKDPGLDKISMKAIRDLPMMMGERNILSISALLPGIVTTGEGAAGLNVRGGGADQNAFYINKIPIYNTAHLFGFFPAFNSDIIRDFSIYKGYVPANYGGRLSSVFDIVTRHGNLKHFTAHGGISPITGNIVVEGPIKKDTCSIILSARSSYSDWILKKIKNPTIRNSSAKFYDLSGGINYDIQKVQMALFVYRSYDRFKLSDINDYEYGNTGASMSFSHRINNAVHATYSLIASQYEFSTTDKEEESSAYSHGYAIGHYEARADLKHILNDRNTLEYGAGMLLYKLDRGNVTPFGAASLRKPVILGKEQGVEGDLYISDSYDVKSWMNLTLGLRFAMYAPIGDKTVFTYTPDSPRELTYVNDTLQFDKNEAIRWYAEPDVRAAVNIKTGSIGSVKLAFNQMHQNLFMLNNTVTIAPNTQWKLADYHLKPSRSQQVSVGLFRTLRELGLEASVEFYYKFVKNYPDFKDGADFLKSPYVETTVLQGKQNAYGVECFLKRTGQRLEGWLSYTYSRSKETVTGNYPWDKINEGVTFPANFDIPHAVNLVLTYHYNRRIIFSSITTLQSGKPTTYPVSVYYLDGYPTLDFSSRNAYRIPNFFRTDLSVTIEGDLKRNKLLHSSLMFNVYNLTGRENPYSVYFNTSNGKIRSYKYSVIGIPIFTVSWVFKLGNYASE